MMLTDFTSGRCTLLRDGDPGARGHLVHCHATRRGIAYEVPGESVGGLYDPLTRRRFRRTSSRPQFKYIHTGPRPRGAVVLPRKLLGLGQIRHARPLGVGAIGPPTRQPMAPLDRRLADIRRRAEGPLSPSTYARPRVDTLQRRRSGQPNLPRYSCLTYPI